MWGPRLREMSETAVLNANYVLARLKDAYDLPFDRLCMHEFVLSARNLKRDHGVTALDVAKRLMDYGYHPPTIYFPLVVPEALMIEPTETETKETLDAFCDAMLAIAKEAAEQPELLKEAPHHRPVRRLDEVRAAKQPVVKYGFERRDDAGRRPSWPYVAGGCSRSPQRFPSSRADPQDSASSHPVYFRPRPLWLLAGGAVAAAAVLGLAPACPVAHALARSGHGRGGALGTLVAALIWSEAFPIRSSADRRLQSRRRGDRAPATRSCSRPRCSSRGDVVTELRQPV